MRRWTMMAGGLLLAGVLHASAADYQVTVTIDDEGLAYLQRVYPGLTAPQLRAKVGDVCSQQIQEAGARDVTTMAERLVQKYRRLTPEQKATMRDTLKTLQED